jgi:hypothetical protein
MRLARAWRRIVAGGDPDVVTRLAADVARIPVPASSSVCRWLGIPPDLHGDVELCLRQYVLSLTLYRSLQPGLLLAATGRRASIPVPPEWRAWLRARGLDISEPGSRLRYAALAAREAIRGLRLAAALASLSISRRLPDTLAGSAVFARLPAGFVPGAAATPDTHFVLGCRERIGVPTLYLETAASRSDLPAGVVAIAQPVPRLPSATALLRFVGDVLRGTITATACGGAGTAWPALLARDTVLLHYARRAGVGRLPRGYAFENSTWMHRPLHSRWAARAAGVPSYMVFYSTNMDEAVRTSPDVRPTFLPGYGIMDWDGYWAWDDWHAELMAAFGQPHERIQVVGPQMLPDNGLALEIGGGRLLSVFDVAPHAPSRLAAIGLVNAYYTAEIAARFLRDIAEEGAAAGYSVAMKQKRDIGRREDPRYRRARGELARRGLLHAVDAGVSAQRLAGVSDLVVCFPFTSPALFPTAPGGVSVFYDPTGNLIATERQRHGRRLIRGRDELRAFLAEAAAPAEQTLVAGRDAAGGRASKDLDVPGDAT